MIKVNLALRKQASTATDKGTKSRGLPQVSINTDSLKSLLGEPRLRQLVLLSAALFAGYTILEGTKSEMLKKEEVEFTQLSTDSAKLRAEVAKTRGYEETKKALEADEIAIRTKIDTIQRLIADRQILPKVMQSVAQVIPPDVWLTEFKISNDDYTFKGFSLGYNQVSDFMRNLNESAFFTELKLSSSQAARDETGSDVAQFELGARKRQ